MPKRLTSLIIVSLVVLSSCSASDSLRHGQDALPADVGSLAGSYVLNGIDPLGNEYTGHLKITAAGRSGSYDLMWIVTEGFQEGLGRIQGNTLEVEWHTSDQAALTAAGTGSFTVTIDGELYGAKRVDGDEGEWRETAYPLQPGEG